MELFELIRTLTRVYGPSGDEAEIRQTLEELIRPCADEVYTDALGNLIAHKRGSGPKLLFSAHLDSIGLMVTHIEKDGTLRVGKVGGVSPYATAYTPVRFKNGTRGVLVPEEKAEAGKWTLDDCYVDIGASDAAAAATMVRVGDVAVYDGAAFRSGDQIVSPYLDDRSACAVLAEAMGRLEPPRNDLWLVFSVQEEVGCRGAKTAAYGVAPDYGIAVDVTDSCDIPGCRKNGTTRLGGGAAVKIMDHSVVCHPDVVAKLEQAAAAQGIKVQRDIMRAGGTDAGAIHLTGNGVPTGGISIPCRYVHTPVETASLKDIEECVRLTVVFAQAELT